MSARDARQRSRDSNGRHPAQVVHARAAHGQLIAERAPKAWIDYTGAGRVVFNIFKRERVPHIMPATIISGARKAPTIAAGTTCRSRRC
jgi:hypothetical protein